MSGFQETAPERGVAAEEFCVFGDWGGSLNKPEKPENSGGFFANGAPLALLAKFALRKIFSICETKCPCVPYYPYRVFSFIDYSCVFNKHYTMSIGNKTKVWV
ncbi:MAG: hypothetical protein IKC46_11565 [Lachnospiraceae bacterium]|nr:hypothetical protein [Lachnospiraceae bacterium]